MGYPNKQSNPAAAMPVYVVGGGGSPPPGATAKGTQTITGLSSVKTLTVPDGATTALVQAETQNVRWTDSGTNPTASVGIIIAAGNTQTFQGAAELAALKFIETTASAQLNVSYYG